MKQFPILKVNLVLQGNNDDYVQPVPVGSDIIDVFSQQEYVLVINLHRLNKPITRSAYSPCYHKAKSEGWFLSLGNIESGELLAMRRVNGPYNKTSVHLTFCTPPKLGNDLNIYMPTIISLTLIKEVINLLFYRTSNFNSLCYV